MAKKGKSSATKIIALLLSVIIMVGAIPALVFAKTASYPSKYSVVVKDDQGKAMDGVAVTIKPAGESEISLDMEGETDQNGVADFDLTELKTALEDAQQTSFDVEITASKEGYLSVDANAVITEIESETETIEADLVLLKSKTEPSKPLL